MLSGTMSLAFQFSSGPAVTCMISNSCCLGTSCTLRIYDHLALSVGMHVGALLYFRGMLRELSVTGPSDLVFALFMLLVLW